MWRLEAFIARFWLHIHCSHSQQAWNMASSMHSQEPSQALQSAWSFTCCSLHNIVCTFIHCILDTNINELYCFTIFWQWFPAGTKSKNCSHSLRSYRFASPLLLSLPPTTRMWLHQKYYASKQRWEGLWMSIQTHSRAPIMRKSKM